MTRSLLVLLLAAGAGSCLAANAQLFPFQSVVLRGDTIEATLPQNARWLVESPPASPRLSKPSEVFRLRDGQSLRLVERHSTYRCIARVSAQSSGLAIENTFDTHSFGGATTIKTYFIQAR